MTVKRRWVWAAITILLVIGTCVGLRTTMLPTGHAYQYPECVQILANDNELWVFLEVRTYYKHSSILLGRPEVVAADYYCVRYDGKWTGPLKIRCARGSSFNPNIGAVMRHQDTFYLISVSEETWDWTVSKWEGEAFHELTAQEILAVQKTCGFDETLSPTSNRERIDAMTRAAGWRVLVRDTMFHSPLGALGDDEYDRLSKQLFRVEWRGKQFAALLVRNGSMGTLRLVDGDDPTTVVHDLVSFDATDRSITGKQYRKLRHGR